MPTLPKSGIAPDEVLAAMMDARGEDADWRRGRLWSLVYHGGAEHTGTLHRAYELFSAENGLSPKAFPSLARFEAEIIGMLAGLLGDAGARGSMTSCGSESIMLAVKAYRDHARVAKPRIWRPEMLVPSSAHPAFFKAAEYLDVVARPIPVGPDYRAVAGAMADAVNGDTILLVGSAPSFPQGVVDPIDELGRIALDRGVGLHVDACLGTFMLAFLDRIGRSAPRFDFRVPGVTSVSADLHKYGYAAKGASAVLYREPKLLRSQVFVYKDWPGGHFSSPGVTGTRPGGIIAAAYAALLTLGTDGYTRLAREAMELTGTLLRGIRGIPGLHVLGKPDMSVFAFAADGYDIYAVADALEKKGWHMDRQNNPNSLHMIVTPHHGQAVGAFLEDLRAATARARQRPPDESSRRAVLYGITDDAGTG
ncbi:MAG: pyridoxal-dependent decarboxylase [Pseudomonadota bacterium]|nr:pyridoxal-dependent decarboxylase [Pseudomonadota bacterium]